MEKGEEVVSMMGFTGGSLILRSEFAASPPKPQLKCSFQGIKFKMNSPRHALRSPSGEDKEYLKEVFNKATVVRPIMHAAHKTTM
ncbi:hypothetical protein E2C01_077427 [Portunus trituberculatus]|uniref:Uncharacterized protein n=1 Tax=Portunus trituberculatus TaxID=210409 RepID=A0A5B7IK88_PORTR|nr:hypothetical protein [Portunus trituberculatus]